jgi:hypothetical protein
MGEVIRVTCSSAERMASEAWSSRAQVRRHRAWACPWLSGYPMLSPLLRVLPHIDFVRPAARGDVSSAYLTSVALVCDMVQSVECVRVSCIC